MHNVLKALMKFYFRDSDSMHNAITALLKFYFRDSDLMHDALKAFPEILFLKFWFITLSTQILLRFYFWDPELVLCFQNIIEILFMKFRFFNIIRTHNITKYFNMRFCINIMHSQTLLKVLSNILCTQNLSQVLFPMLLFNTLCTQNINEILCLIFWFKIGKNFISVWIFSVCNRRPITHEMNKPPKGVVHVHVLRLYVYAINKNKIRFF